MSANLKSTMMKINSRKRKTVIKFIPIYLMMLPGFIYLVCNNYLPMYGITIAFKQLDVVKGLVESPWVGLKNFQFLMMSDTAGIILRNTVLYNLLFIVLGSFFSIAVAIIINEVRCKIASRLYQSLLLLPHLMSWVVVNYMAYAFLSFDTGFLNGVIKSLGFVPVSWYANPSLWPYILTFITLWKTTGFSMILYLSSIVGISKDYYEAATIDGASRWQQIRRITMPLLKPTIITLLILSLGRIVASDFGLFYQIPRNSPALYNVTQTIDVFVYNALMRRSDYGMSSAAGVFQSIVGFVMIMLSNSLVRKAHRDSSLF